MTAAHTRGPRWTRPRPLTLEHERAEAGPSIGAAGRSPNSADDGEALLLRADVAGRIGGRDDNGVGAGLEARPRHRPGPGRRRESGAGHAVHGNTDAAAGRTLTRPLIVGVADFVDAAEPPLITIDGAIVSTVNFCHAVRE